MSTKQLEKEATSEKKDKQSKEESDKEATKSGQVTSRAEIRQKRKENKEAKRKNKKPKRRIFPIWLRLIVVITLCALALTVGAMIGFGILGDGSPMDALKVETWRHIIDIVTKE